MTRPAVTGLILAGGMGRRMGSTDKGLTLLDGQPFVAHVIARLAPQVDSILINANRNLDRYAAFGHPVVADAVADFAGPLAGLERGLAQATSDWVAMVPCDSPFLPGDLVARLLEHARAVDADLAVARALGRAHPVFCLARRSLHADLAAWLREGGRKIDAWYARLHCVMVDFDDEADAFMNINTPQELAAVARPADGNGSES